MKHTLSKTEVNQELVFRLAYGPERGAELAKNEREGNALRKLQQHNGIYRGWNVYGMASGYGIRKQGWQGYANFKTIENAKAKIDAIVG